MSDTKQASAPREKRTLIEEETELEGTLSSRCPIDVMGKVKGDVSGPSIHIRASGVVDGTIRVQELRSEGELAGSVDAERVQLSGRVRDHTVIRARSLEVQLARTEGKMEVVFGDCQLEVGDEPNKAQAVADALRRPAPVADSAVAASAPAVLPTTASADVGAAPPAANEAAAADHDGKSPDAGWTLPTNNGPTDGSPVASASPAPDEQGAKDQNRRDRRRQASLPPASD